MKTTIAKDLVRNPYAWPGGYERVGITSDNAVLCTDCIKANWHAIVDSTRNEIHDGWWIVAAAYEATPADCCPDEYASYCDHCNKEFGELC